MTTTRIGRVAAPDLAAPDVAGFVAELSKARGGRLLNIDTVLLHCPEFARASRELFRVVRNRFGLSDRVREIVCCRVAALNRAPYEFHQHAGLALDAGLTQAQLDALQQPGVPTGFDADETEVIRFIDAMTLDVQVPETLFDGLRGRLGDRGIVELAATVASYNSMSRLLEALDVEIER